MAGYARDHLPTLRPRSIRACIGHANLRTLRQGDLRRIRQLDGLRAVAILAVFLHHAWAVPLLWAGVDLFFVLSGFLITSILLSHRSLSAGEFFGSFYRRRARRIMPPYLLFLLIASLVVGIDWKHLWYWYAFFGANIAAALWVKQEEAVTLLWSLAVEEQFYLFWPVLVYFAPPRHLTRYLAFFICAAPVARLIATPLVSTHFPIYFLTPFRMDLLAGGALIAVLLKDDPEWARRHSARALAVLAFAAFSFCALTVALPSFRTGANSALFNSAGYSLVMLACASLLIVCLSLSRRGQVYRVLTTRWLVYVGTISYSMYLIHQLALGTFAGLDPLSKAGAGLTATIAYAAVSWELMERRLPPRSALRLPPAF